MNGTDQEEFLKHLDGLPKHLYTHAYIECVMHDWMHVTQREEGVAAVLQGYDRKYAREWKRLLPRDRVAPRLCRTCVRYYVAHRLQGTNPHEPDTDVLEQLHKLGVRVFRSERFIPGQPPR